MKNKLSNAAAKKLRRLLSEGRFQREELFHILDTTPCTYTKIIIVDYLQNETLRDYLLVGSIAKEDCWLLENAEKRFIRHKVPFRDLLSSKAVSPMVRSFFSPKVSAIQAEDMKQIWYDYDMKQGY